jgi:hypothetical protein
VAQRQRSPTALANSRPTSQPAVSAHRFADIQPATQDRSLLDAMAVVSKHRHTRGDELSDSVDLGFASQRWQNFVIKRRPLVCDRRT